jgi:hypothetical protein
VSELTWRQVIARRLARSHLLDPAPRTRVVDVVRDVGLIQAQVLSAAEIGLCLRVRGITAADVRRELYQRRSLVKTWSLRGTLHLVPADELAFWAAAARGLEPFWEAREWLAKHDLTPRRAGALFDAIADALDGRCLTRAELVDAAGEERLLSGWASFSHHWLSRGGSASASRGARTSRSSARISGAAAGPRSIPRTRAARC